MFVSINYISEFDKVQREAMDVNLFSVTFNDDIVYDDYYRGVSSYIKLTMAITVFTIYYLIWHKIIF